MTNEYLSIAIEISKSKTPNTSKMVKNFILAIDSLKSKIAEQEAEIAALKKPAKPVKKAAPKKTSTKKTSAK